MNMNRIRILPLLILLALPSCATKPQHSDDAAADYAKAKHLMDIGSYSDANLFLEQFDAKHPYSRFTIQAELLRIFAAYKDGEFVLSETLSERFIDQHPRHPDVAYAKYMLAMSHYKQIGKADRDPTQTLAAVDSFKKLLKEHPDSNYAKDGAKRLQLLYNRLAAHELEVGKYYFDNGRYVASANRFQGIVENYQTTTSIEEALYYLAASYAKLGMKKDASEMAVLLRHNFPRSDWSEKAKPFL
ncbi:MAG TPA: outer membrane protein assembly factor BamD [Mariprofundaceae bacterium]|nr:outer membrane protein assembly factor BamD [Mariprofundaceae bacterium]